MLLENLIFKKVPLKLSRYEILDYLCLIWLNDGCELAFKFCVGLMPLVGQRSIPVLILLPSTWTNQQKLPFTAGTSYIPQLYSCH